jgi:ABC-2 type transport system permease protein
MTASDVSAGEPLAPEAAAPATLARTHPYLWSVRREIWENQAIWIAPLALAGLVLAGMTIGLFRIPRGAIEITGKLDAATAAKAAQIPFDVAAFVIFVTSLVVAFFYCLGALHNERRDRSILFWKSLPVSDLAAVLAKLTVPLVAIPVVASLIVLATWVVIMVASFATLPAVGLPPGLLWNGFPPARSVLDLAYTVAVASLWYAPVWGWLLMVSGWARRAPILWAIGVPLGAAIFERLAFNTTYLWTAVHDRLFGMFRAAFATTVTPKGHVAANMDALDPLKLIESPALWIGLVVAAAFIAAAVWQRRWRTPL